MISTMPARLHVAIDAHTVGRRATGNETYVIGLLEGLAGRDDVDPVAVLEPGRELPADVGVRSVTLPRRGPLPRLLADLRRAGHNWGADVLHVQYVRPLRSDVPVVTTIHDISFEHFTGLFTWRSRVRMRITIPWSARHSEAILTGSQHSKRDLVERYGLAPNRIWVTPYAADARFCPQPATKVEEVLARHGLPRDYLLSVGNLQPRKNLPRLLDAYVRLSADRPPLVVVGQRAWLDHDVFATLRRLGLQKLVYLTGYVPSEDLPALYSGALAFAYPSLYEGFGLPVLEAMACGAPTLSSRTSSIPEVAGDAAILVDPLDVEAIAEGLDRLIASDELRASLRERGFAQASLFSWEHCAAATINAYLSAVR